MTIYKRRRGTAIVETDKGILLTAGRNKTFMLPGGGAEKNETRLVAAIRELKEETGLDTISAKFLFRFTGSTIHKSHQGGYFQDYHTVVLIQAKGTPKPHHEIKYIDYTSNTDIKISKTTKEILEKFYEYKKKNQN